MRRTIEPLLAAGFMLLSLVLPSAAFAQREGATFGTIAGSVRDTLGLPLADVSVAVVELGRTTATTAGGAFRFDGVPEGLYTVHIRRIRLSPIEHQIRVRRGETARVDVVMIPRVEMLMAVVVRGQRSGLYGTVRDLAGEPIPGAEVHVDGSGRRRANADGTFHFAGLGTGRYLARVTARGFAPRIFSFAIPPNEGREVSIRLRRGTMSNREEYDWQTAALRRRWRTTSATFLVAEDLTRGAYHRVPDVPALVAEAGDSPCLAVDGAPSALPLEHFVVDDVEAVEVYPPGSVFGAPTGTAGGGRSPRRQHRSLGQLGSGGTNLMGERSDCTSHVFIWLKRR